MDVHRHLVSSLCCIGLWRPPGSSGRGLPSPKSDRQQIVVSLRTGASGLDPTLGRWPECRVRAEGVQQDWLLFRRVELSPTEFSVWRRSDVRQALGAT